MAIYTLTVVYTVPQCIKITRDNKEVFFKAVVTGTATVNSVSWVITKEAYGLTSQIAVNQARDLVNGEYNYIIRQPYTTNSPISSPNPIQTITAGGSTFTVPADGTIVRYY